jgi:thiol-disulfide isomerase/thioredoxin
MTTPKLARGILLASTLLVSPVLRADTTLPLGAALPAANAPLATLDGKTTSLARLVGKRGTLVLFTCNHCPFVKAWEQRIAALANRYPAKGVGVILVNANDPAIYPEDDVAGMRARAKALGLRAPYLVDATSNVARAFAARVTPEAFLFDAQGKLAYHGTIDDNKADPAKVTAHYLRDALDAVVAGAKPDPAETKSLGCGIKFRAGGG